MRRRDLMTVLVGAMVGWPLAVRAQQKAMPVIGFLGVASPAGEASMAAFRQARPSGNLTGFSTMGSQLNPKRLELLSELVPEAKVIALLVNPNNSSTETIIRDMTEAARSKGVQLLVLKAGTESEIDTAFATLVDLHAGGLIVAGDPFFFSRREQLLALASRHAVPANYVWREFAAAGGLVSYGVSITDSFRQSGSYAGRILKGAKPAELPVQQPTTFALVVNLNTAKALGLTIPHSMLMLADEVIEMKRRDIMALLAVAAALRTTALRAQQKAMPVIGFLGAAAPPASFMAAFRQGLTETGYIEGQNLAIEYRWAENNYDQLPALAADLVGRKVDVIVAFAVQGALAAKDATLTIPIVFTFVGDPVGLGLVASLARPGGNVTGFSNIVSQLTPKRLELLAELVPQAGVMALLVNPNSRTTEPLIPDMQEAARTKGVQLHVLKAGTEREIDAAFATLVELHADGLVVAGDPFIFSRRDQLVALASRHAVPAIYPISAWAEAGGLISYGTSLAAVMPQVGSYSGRILKGAKPADLPVQQPTTFELVVNLKTAKALGLTVPPSILARADEVIE